MMLKCMCPTVDSLASIPGAQLCDLVQVTEPLCASVPLPIKMYINCISWVGLSSGLMCSELYMAHSKCSINVSRC